jgi:circadian clock protein KaiC
VGPHQPRTGTELVAYAVPPQPVHQLQGGPSRIGKVALPGGAKDDDNLQALVDTGLVEDFGICLLPQPRVTEAGMRILLDPPNTRRSPHSGANGGHPRRGSGRPWGIRSYVRAVTWYRGYTRSLGERMLTFRSKSRHMPDTTSLKLGTGVPGLDDVLGGGLPQGRLYLVEGDPGTGKTTLALQFLLEGVRQGETALYATLTETGDELRAVAQSHGWSLDGIDLCDVRPDTERGTPDADLTIVHPGEVELGEITTQIVEEVKRVRPARMVLDSVTELRLLARDPLRHRRQVLYLKRVLDEAHCTAVLLDDLSAQHGDLQLQSISHGALRLEQLPGDYGTGHRRLRVLKLRGVAYREGFHEFRIARGGLTVFPRLIAAEHETSFPPEQVPSGIPALDALLGGGLDRGAVVLIMGSAGTGKSVLAAHYAMRIAARGERATVYLFEESVRMFVRRAAGLAMQVDEYIEGKLLTVRQVNPTALTPSEFVNRVRDDVERDHARLVVIDSLNGYLAAMPDDRALALNLRELARYLSQQGVLTLLIVAEHGLVGGALTAPIDVSYVADTVIALRYLETGGAVRRAIAGVKRRSGPHAHTIHELEIGSPIIVGAPLTGFEGVLAGIVRRLQGPSPEDDDSAP